MQAASKADIEQMMARLWRLHRGDEEGRRHRRRRSPAADRGGDHGARRQRQDQGARRPLRRHQGAARRLLHHRRARSRRGALLGGALPGRQPRRDRGPPDLGRCKPSTMPREDDAARARPPKRWRAAATASSSPFSRRARATSRAPRTRLSEAFAAALADWPASGVPDKPGGLAADGGAAQADRCGAPAAHAARTPPTTCA